MSEVECKSSGGGLGCLPTLLLIYLVYAMVFGVTINNKHYEIECSESHGVEFRHGEVVK